jgi:membrane protein DedA with SNARE-associated domain
MFWSLNWIVFVARFLPFLRNMAGMLAGVHRMAPERFFLASSAAAVGSDLRACRLCLRRCIRARRSPATIALAAVALLIVVSLPAIILRWKKRLLAQAQLSVPDPPPSSSI